MRSRKSLAPALFVLLLIAPTLHAEQRVSEPFLGVKVREVTFDQPRPLVICIAEIDLKAEGISLLITPGNGDPNGDEPGDPNGETTRQTTLQFLKDHKAQLAINATFFGMDKIGTDNIGLVVSNGEHVSPFRGDWPAINIDPDNNPAIVRGDDNTYHVTRPAPDKVTLHNAVTGSDQIVIDGKPLDNQPDRSFFTTAHPRTVIGITKDHKLLLVTVDGRQPGISEGMPLDELAQLMIELGAVQALNLDGGGSTTMAIADPDPRLLNTPSSKDAGGNYGVQRANGTSLAVFATPNPDYTGPNTSKQPQLQVSSDFISTPGPYYLSQRVDVRLASSDSGRITNRLDRQSRVEVYEFQDGWARISRYYDGQTEGVSGHVARWIPVAKLVKERPSDPEQSAISIDTRITGIPDVGEGGLTKRDVQILHAAARYYLEIGKAELIVYGDKSVNKSDVYYLNFNDDFKNHFFLAENIPDLEDRIKKLGQP